MEDKGGNVFTRGLWLLLVVLLLSFLVWAVHTGEPQLITPDFTTDIGSGPSLLNPDASVGAVKKINVSGTYNLTLVLNKNASHKLEHIVNVSIMFFSINGSGYGASAINFTITNVTGEGCSSGAAAGWTCTNRTWWNRSVNTRSSIPDGVYNLTVFIYNETNTTYETGGAGSPLVQIINFTLAVNVTVDNTAPNVTLFIVNSSNYHEFNTSSSAGMLNVNASVNDSLTFTKSVSFGFTTSRNATGWNVTAPANLTFYHTQINILQISEGVYTVSLYANDTVNNMNNSVSNITLRIDRSAPNITLFILNSSNYHEFNTSSSVGMLNVNASVNDSLTFTKSVSFGFTTTRNATGWNVTAPANLTFYHTQINIAPLIEGVYTVTVYANDTVDNMNYSVSNVTLRVDRTPPNVSFITTNISGISGSGNLNATNSPNLSDGGFIRFNISVNDSLTFATSVTLGFNNSKNLTQFNVSPTVPSGTGEGTSSYSWVYNLSLDGVALIDGTYRVTVYTNDTVNNMNYSVTNLSFVFDATPPNITLFILNSSNYHEFNTSSSAGMLNVNASVNDSTTFTKSVSFGFTTTRNATGWNVTAPANLTFYHTQINILQISEGVYTVSLYANDTVDNMNNTVSNITLRIDRSAPNITLFIVNGSNYREFNVSTAAGHLNVNASVNDSLTFTKSVSFGFTTSRNATGWNVTAPLNYTFYHTQVNLGLLTEGVYTVSLYANDTVDNINNSVSNVTIRLDLTPPNITLFIVNGSNYREFNVSGSGGILNINASVNDSTTFTKSVSFGLTTTRNTTGFNVSAAPNLTFYHAQINFAPMIEGVYTVTLYANDTVDNMNYSVSNVTLRVDRTPPNITLFQTNGTTLNASNWTNGGHIRINVTLNDSLTFAREAHLGIENIDRSFNNLTQFNASLTQSTYVWTVDLALSTLVDGIYRVHVYTNDTVNNMNNSVRNISFVVDSTGPNVTGLLLGNISSGTNLSDGVANASINRIVNMTVLVNDTVTYVVYVNFNISNSSGAVHAWLHNGTRNRTHWNATAELNISELAEGVYYIQIAANDTLGNRNTTEKNFSFRVDRTPPVVTVSCGGPYTAGQTVTCTCSATDTGGSLVQTGPRFSNGEATETTTAAGTSGTSSGCEAIDYAGNIKSQVTGTWTVSASSGGGGGSSGASGGATAGIVAQFEKRIWTSINAGETATVSVANGVLGVTEVSFVADDTTYGAWVEVKKVDELPSTVKGFTGSAYKTLEIKENNVKDILKDDKATVKFKVEKAWLTSKGLTKSDVALFRYNNGAWSELTTALTSEDDTYIYYSAETPGFSYFVIGGKKGAAAPVEKEEQPAPSLAEEQPVPAVEEVPTEAPAVEAPPAALKKAVKAVWVVPLLVAIVLGLVLWLYWKKR